MYICSTTRCNMMCSHCAFSCTWAGEDMLFDTFKKAIAQDSEVATIGGGEPTVHRNFWKFLAYAIGHCENVWLATNGRRTEDALVLAKMAKRGILSVALSQDRWHDPIREEVVRAFTKSAKLQDLQARGYGGHSLDLREIRTVTELNRVGRATQLSECEVEFARSDCPCPDIFVRVNGDIHICGCVDSPKIGDVCNGFDMPDGYEWDGCYKKED